MGLVAGGGVDDNLPSNRILGGGGGTLAHANQQNRGSADWLGILEHGSWFTHGLFALINIQIRRGAASLSYFRVTTLKNLRVPSDPVTTLKLSGAIKPIYLCLNETPIRD